MSSEVGQATVSVFPTFKGFRQKFSSEVDGATKTAGLSAGKGFSAAFDASTGNVGAAAARKLSSNVATASQALSKARLAEQDATGRVRVAESALAEARSKGAAGSARVVAAEERLASAQRKLTDSTGKTKSASDQLRDAQTKLKDATDSTASTGEKAAGRYSKGWAGIKSRISGDLSKAVQDAGTDASRVSEAGGRESGGKFTGAFKGALAGVATVFAASKIKDFFVSGIESAGLLEQSVGAVGAIFKTGAAQMNSWASTAATDVGLTKNEFNELGTLIGAQLKNGGTAMEELGPKTKDLIGLGADLSSMFGGTSREAVEALSSALKGERDPIERYGVSLNQTKIDAEAAALGFEKVGGALSAEANQAATLSLIMKQTADSHGNFAKENDTLAGKQQRLTAIWANGKATLATAFLPAVTAVTGVLVSGLSPALAGAESLVKEISGGFLAFSAAFKAADGDITSSGFPGFMERVGYAASLLWAGLTMPAGVTDSLGAPLDGLVAVGAAIRRTMDEARGGLRAMAAAFRDGGTDVTSSGFAGVLEAVGLVARNLVDAFGPVISQIGPHILSLVQAISPLAIILGALAPVLPQLSVAAAELAVALGSVLAGALQVIVPIIVGILTGVAGLVSGFMRMDGASTALAAGITTLVVGLGLYKVALFAIRAVLGAVAVATKAWAVAQGILTAVMSANPIMLVVVAVAALVAGVVLLVKNWSTVAGFFAGIWDKIAAGASAFLVFLKDLFFKFHPLGIIISNWGAITGFFAGLWSNIVAGAVAFGAGFVAFFTALPGMLLQGLIAVGTAILQGIATGIALAVVGLAFIFTELPGMILGWLAEAGIWLLQTGTDLIAGLIAGIQTGYQAVAAFFTELPGKIAAFLVTAAAWLVASGTALLSGLRAGIVKGYESVTQFFKELPGRVVSFLAAGASWLVNGGLSLLRGLLNGISNGYTSVSGFFRELPGRVKAFLSAARDWLIDSGRNILAGLMGGISNGFTAVAVFFRDLPGRIMGALANARSWLVSAGMNALYGLLGGLYAAWGSVTGFVYGIPRMFFNAVSGAGSWLYNTGRNVVQGLLNGLSSLAGTVGQFFLNLLPGWIVGPFKAALGIHSPSRVFRDFGGNIGEGLLLGVGDKEAGISDKMQNLVAVPGLPSWSAGDTGKSSGRAVLDRSVNLTVNQKNYNPVAEPGSKKLETASSLLALVGSI